MIKIVLSINEEEFSAMVTEESVELLMKYHDIDVMKEIINSLYSKYVKIHPT